MPLFSINEAKKLTAFEQKNFSTEKELQTLIETNLQTVFGCQLVATEFSTGAQHAGRIDTLALSEDNNPVIIEYKKVEASDLINQSLFYLAWLNDHRGDFEIAAQKALGTKIEVDWSSIRVICIAPNYRKYDLHAVQMMGANIELWAYRLYKNNALYLEEILKKSYAGTAASSSPGTKNPIMVAAGKKAAVTKANSNWSFDPHITNKSTAIKDIALAVQEYMMGLDPSMEEAPKKYYVAYKISKNIVCMEVQKKKVIIYLRLNPKEHPGPKGLSRDVTNIGHFGTGDLEITLKSLGDLEAAKASIVSAYQHIGA